MQISMETSETTHEEWKVIIEDILSQIRPALAEHSGDATLVKIEGKKVFLELSGSCSGCPMSSMTFGIMVDEMIKEKIPEVEEVVYE